MVVLISFTLMTYNVALAANTSTTNEVTSTGNTTSGNYKTHDVVEDTDTSSTAFLNTLTSLIAAYVVSTLIVMCTPIPYDLYAAGAASVVKTLGEIATFKSMTDDLEAAQKKYNESLDKNEETQREALTSLKKVYEELHDTLEMKKDLQVAVAAIYLAAAGIATGLYIYEQSLDASITSISTTQKAAESATTAGTGPCMTGGTAAESEYFVARVQDPIPGPSATKSHTIMAKTAANNALATTCTSASAPIALRAAALKSNYVLSCNGLISSTETKGQEFNQLTKILATQLGLSDKESQIIMDDFIQNHLKKERQIAFSPITEKLLKSGFELLPNIERDVKDITTPNAISRYISYREKALSASGERHSMTMDEYSRLESLLNSPELSSASPEDQRDFLEYAIESGVDLVFPSAHALDVAQALGMAGPILVSWLATKYSLSLTIDAYLSTPLTRAIVWGVLAGLTYAGIGTLEEKINVIQSRIDELAALIDQYKSHQEDSQDTAGGDDDDGNEDENPNLPDEKNDPVSLDSPNISRPIVVDTECIKDIATGECITSAGLNSEEKKKQAEDVFKTLYPEFANDMASLTGRASKLFDDVQNALEKGIVSKDLLGQAAALGNDFGKMNKHLETLRAKFNKDEKNAGKRPTDFKGLQAKLSKSLTDGVKASLASKGFDAKSMMDSLTSGNNLNTKTAGKNSAAKSIKGSGVNSNKAKKSWGNKKIDTLGGSQFPATPENLSPQLSGDQLNYRNIDISSKQGASIFDILSARYFSSAYPKLFIRVKTEPKKK